MYIKGFTYIWFAVLFMWLGSFVTDMIGQSVNELWWEVHEEQVLATTQSLQETAFRLPWVFIMMPTGDQGMLYKYGCYSK